MYGIRQASMKRMQPSRSVSTSKVTTPPKPASVRLAIAWSGWLGEARVPDAPDARVLLEEARHAQAVRVVALHAQRERLEAAQQQIGRVRVGDAAEHADGRADRRHLLVAAQHDPAEQVVVARRDTSSRCGSRGPRRPPAPGGSPGSRRSSRSRRRRRARARRARPRRRRSRADTDWSGDSVKNSRVSGRIASASCLVSAGSITVVSTSSLVRYWRMNCRVRR